MANGFEERVDRLPKWAQARIDKLERDVAYWQAKAQVGPEESDTFVWLGRVDGSRGLGKGETIRFMTGPDHFDYVDVSNEGNGSVQVRTMGGLVMSPRAGNVIDVRNRERQV